ncbi:MAG: methylenetetrahydrofolate reductase C-terminal domain-containing protein [Victivallales bacterium]|nr:methylenetetrahydrofolate reductase C-terminal domain-containing protein [Victivallales bacterium]
MDSATKPSADLGDNRISQFLRDPSFFVMVELATGEESSRGELLRQISQDSRVFGTLVDDDSLADSQKKRLEEAMAVTAKPSITVLTGAGRSSSALLSRSQDFLALGQRTFLAVSGDLQANATEYTDSVDTLELLRGKAFSGAVVNPFQYLHEEQLLQYAKMVRKLHAGAQFLVAQTGWDMAKYQELIWFMRSRELLVPILARITVIDHEIARKNNGSLHPGIPLPLYLAANATRKDAESPDAELERAAQIALGCNLMGYSGILLAGIHTAEQLTRFLDLLDNARAQTPTWTDWVKAWNTRYQGVSFVPFGGKPVNDSPFYLYQALMNPDVAQFNLDTARPAQAKIPMPAWKDLLHGFCLSHQKLLGKLSSKIRKLDPNSPILALDNSDCPKRLCHGPCGNARIDGFCEDAHGPCFFQRVLRLAAWKKTLDRLEVPDHE